jgi:hypothetical protein
MNSVPITQQRGALAVAEQALRDKFFDIDNVVTVSIEMDESGWDILRTRMAVDAHMNSPAIGMIWVNVPRVNISGSTFLTVRRTTSSRWA